jgi:hypothetical protein
MLNPSHTYEAICLLIINVIKELHANSESIGAKAT